MQYINILKSATPPQFEATAQLAVNNADNRAQAIKALKRAKARLKNKKSKTVVVNCKTVVTYDPKVTSESNVRKTFSKTPK